MTQIITNVEVIYLVKLISILTFISRIILESMLVHCSSGHNPIQEDRFTPNCHQYLLSMLLALHLMGFSFLLVLLILDMTLTTQKHGMVMINPLDILSMFVWAHMTSIILTDIICTLLVFYQTICKIFLHYAHQITILPVSQILKPIPFLRSPKIKRL